MKSFFWLVLCCFLSSHFIWASPTPQPISLILPSGTLGAFDPSLEAAPDGSTLWMAYSGASLSGLASPDNISIGTRLASSTDHGAVWHDAGVSLYTSTVQPLPPPDNQGLWQYEVSSLVLDQDAPAHERWKAFTFRYLVTGGNRLFDHSWIGLKTSSAPEGTWSVERKLFTGRQYVTSDNSFIGPPEITLNSISDGVGGTPLSDCAAFTEPGAISKPGTLYLALNCATGSSNDRIVLLKLTHPAETWSYVGVIVRNSEAPAGFSGLSAADLVTVNGTDYMLASPTNAQYKGCVLYQFAALGAARLVRQNGVPLYQHVVADDGSDNNGACSYDAQATASGILFLHQMLTSGSPAPQTYSSFVRIPASDATTLGGQASLDSIQIFPNPLRPSRGHTRMNFNQLPTEARLRIYTLSGEKVFDTSADSYGSASWDGTNQSGKKVSTGVYLAHVKSGSLSKTFKVAVQR